MHFYISEDRVDEFLSVYNPNRVSHCKDHRWKYYNFIDIDIGEDEYLILKIKFDLRTKDDLWPPGWLAEV